MKDFSQVPSLKAPLLTQIQGLKKGLSKELLKGLDIQGVLLQGSCARGQATYRSDVDLLIVLNTPPLDFGRVKRVRNSLETALETRENGDLLTHPLPVEMTVVLSSVFETREPAMREALRTAIALADPEGAMKRGLQAA